MSPKNVRPFNWIQWLTLTLVVLLSVVVPLNFLAINNTRNQGREALRSFICYFEQAALDQKQTPQQQHAVTAFFDGVLSKLNDSPCK